MAPAQLTGMPTATLTQTPPKFSSLGNVQGLFDEKSVSKTVQLTEAGVLEVRTLRLEIADGPEAGKAIQTDREVVTIGGRPQSTLPLSDRAVSRDHAEIRVTDRGYLLVDLQSTNGTFVDGHRIERAYLTPGTSFVVGRTSLRFLPSQEEVRVPAFVGDRFGEMVGSTAEMRKVFGLLSKVAPLSATVMIRGETGVGKELVARALHSHSSRSDGPLVTVDCGSIPHNLIESELFGHEKGAFTGASESRTGAFERADGGTIFLDELGELPLELQSRLLRVLQERKVRRVGGHADIPLDIRVVAATHRNLEQAVEEEAFRSDLYYRLNVIPIHLPPLRERTADIPMLIEKLRKSGGLGAPAPTKQISPPAMRVLMAQTWPGNVRQLANAVQRAMMFAPREVVVPEDLPELLRSPHGRPTPKQGEFPIDTAVPFKVAREELLLAFEARYLEQLLRECGGNVSEAARRSGIHRKTVERLVKKHGLGRNAAADSS